MIRLPARARGGARTVACSPRSRAASAALLVVLGACAGPGPLAPVGRAPERGASAPLTQGLHAVRPGDTLYAIAWRYGLDYRDLARWNAIPEPFTIYTGQVLRISRPARLPAMPRSEPVAAAPLPAPREPPRFAPQTARRAPERTAAPAKPARPPAPPPRTADAGDGPINAWQWPVRGKLIATFGRGGGKGIDIAGDRGSPVVASAPGRVVYSGSGLRGYGRLIIVKHNKRYLSAYAHNDRLHVKEGDAVVSGQRIAEMGSSDAKRVKLHFEIRRDGKPVDPIRYLPR